MRNSKKNLAQTMEEARMELPQLGKLSDEEKKNLSNIVASLKYYVSILEDSATSILDIVNEDKDDLYEIVGTISHIIDLLVPKTEYEKKVVDSIYELINNYD